MKRIRVALGDSADEDGTVLWSKSYDGAESDVLAFGAEVGAQIADAVVTHLTRMEPYL